MTIASTNVRHTAAMAADLKTASITVLSDSASVGDRLMAVLYCGDVSVTSGTADASAFTLPAGWSVTSLTSLIPTGDPRRLSGAIMVDAVRQRVPIPVLARMGWNLLVDTGLGFVPVGGDAADVMHRANRKNYRLLEKCVAEGRHVDVSTKGYLGLAVATVVGFVLVSLVLVGLLIWGIVSGIGAIVT